MEKKTEIIDFTAEEWDVINEQFDSEAKRLRKEIEELAKKHNIAGSSGGYNNKPSTYLDKLRSIKASLEAIDRAEKEGYEEL